MEGPAFHVLKRCNGTTVSLYFVPMISSKVVIHRFFIGYSQQLYPSLHKVTDDLVLIKAFINFNLPVQYTALFHKSQD
jgi:hypothetical protein